MAKELKFLKIDELQRADDEDKMGNQSDFNLRIYPLQKLSASTTATAKSAPVYDNQMKLLCLENALRF
jgi:hypothetical protein